MPPFAGRGSASPSDRFTPSAAPASASPRALDVLVAGAVDSPVGAGRGFDAPAPARPGLATGRSGASPAAFAMYTRAADRLEVATDVAVGRALDVRG